MESSYQLFVTISLMLVIIFDGWLWWFLYTQPESKLSQKFLQWHIAGVLIWTFSIVLLLYQPLEYIAATTFVAALFFAITKYFFALTFPDNQWPTGWWHYALLLVAVPTIFVAYIPNVIFFNVQVIDGYFFTLENGALAGWYSLLVTYYLLYPIFHLNRKRKIYTEHHLQEQLRFLTYGMSLFFILALITNSILPVFLNIYNFNALGPILSVFLAGFIVYIISRHEFLDLRLIIQRGLIYTILFILVAALYSATLIFSTTFFPEIFLLSEFLSGMLVIGIALVTVPKIDAYLRRITDPIFFKGRYSYRDVLEELSELLQSSLEMDALIQACEEKLQQALRATFVTIADKTNPAGAATLQIPIKLQDKLTGVVLVGEKVSGDRYTDDDRQLLHTFANQAATAMSRVLLYQEVRRRADELEMRVAQRTAELQSLQEKQKSMMLQISHNLQTPLTILQTKIDGLSQKPGLNDIATNLTRSLRDLSEFISELLKFARLENKQVEFSMQPLDLSHTLDELLEEIGIIASDNNVQVVHTIESDLHVLGDERKLREVFMNILSNALKYMRADSVKTITVTTEKSDTSVCCHIADTGIGLSTTQKTKIFDRFYRAGGNDASGTGLGLAISKEIIEQHNGTISVTSEVGVGSVFTICLPMHEVQ